MNLVVPGTFHLVPFTWYILYDQVYMLWTEMYHYRHQYLTVFTFSSRMVCNYRLWGTDRTTKTSRSAV